MRNLTDTALISAGVIAGIGLLVVLTAAGWALNTYEGRR
jgi:hypothetical protein